MAVIPLGKALVKRKKRQINMSVFTGPMGHFDETAEQPSS